MIGIIIIDKSKNISSSGVVMQIKRLIKEKKVGHLGTLDPLASGVLPVCIGKATRLFDYFLRKQKIYIAEFTFGSQTDTLDLEGKVEKTCEYIPTQVELKDAIQSNFLGKIMQMPPKYSSKKVNGQKAYDLARNGKEVTLSKKEVEIFEFEILQQKDKNIFEFQITCSSGTYIRALARDLALSTNSCATMTSLVRTKTGNLTLENAVKLENLTKEKIEEKLISLETILADFQKIEVTQEELKKIRNGIKIEVKWAKSNDNDICIVCEKNIIGIGKIVKDRLQAEIYFI